VLAAVEVGVNFAWRFVVQPHVALSDDCWNERNKVGDMFWKETKDERNSLFDIDATTVDDYGFYQVQINWFDDFNKVSGNSRSERIGNFQTRKLSADQRFYKKSRDIFPVSFDWESTVGRC